MLADWRKTTLAEVIVLQRGYDLTAGQQRPGNVPVMGSAGISGFHNEARASGPGLVIGRSGVGSMGAVHFSRVPFWPHNTTLFSLDFRGNHARFVYYLLKTINFRAFDSGSAQASLNRNYIGAIPVSLPPIAEQVAIADVIGALDDKIDLNRHMNEALEETAQALFKSWFVDFDPVQAKTEGRQPFGIDAATAALFPDRFTESELGELPSGWRLAPLSEVADLNPPRQLAKGALAPYVEMSSLPTSGHRATDWPLREAGSGARFKNGDTLLARITPCLENGKTGYVDFLVDGEIGWGSTEYIVICPRNPIPTEWGYLLARDESFRDFAAKKMEGTTGRQRVSAQSIGRFIVAAMPDPVAKSFGTIVTPLFERMRAASNESISLAELRDYLLPKLLSGEIRVRDAEKLAEAAL